MGRGEGKVGWEGVEDRGREGGKGWKRGEEGRKRKRGWEGLGGWEGLRVE